MGDYNGWSNKETWAVGLWMMDAFKDMASEKEWEKEEFAKHIEEFVWDNIEAPKEGCLLLDIVMTYLNTVDWQELADAALEN